MKGLLLKDFYIIRSILAILAVVFIVIGASLSYLANPWVLTVLATVMLGMNVTSTINVDKSSGCLKTIITTPVSRKSYISSKYIMYLLLSIVGLVFGVVFGAIANLMIGGGTEMMGLFVSVSLTMALLSGSVILPFYIMLDESKSVIGTILAYPVSAGIFIALILLLGHTISTLVITVFVALCLFAMSWYLSTRILAQKDI
ncbi:hypothetical protein C806_03318 [Lachnospiraceae bacterium 3-1]|nr:hypothetical protein C806_03318 [Lachnospiraceae bacterium 3-1]